MLRLLLLLLLLIAVIWIARRARQMPPSRPRPPAPLGRAEALAVLGLPEGATRDQIVQAHRQLIQKLHPDRGGSAALAAQVNLAKDVLLRDIN